MSFYLKKLNAKGVFTTFDYINDFPFFIPRTTEIEELTKDYVKNAKLNLNTDKLVQLINKYYGRHLGLATSFLKSLQSSQNRGSIEDFIHLQVVNKIEYYQENRREIDNYLARKYLNVTSVIEGCYNLGIIFHNDRGIPELVNSEWAKDYETEDTEIVVNSIHSNDEENSSIDIKFLNELLIETAINTPNSSNYLIKIIQRSGFPKMWEAERKQSIINDIEIDSKELLDWALSKGSNPENSNYTVLGSIATSLLDDLGFEKRNKLIAWISYYEQCKKGGIHDNTYFIPSIEKSNVNSSTEFGPSFKTDLREEELHSILKPQPEELELGFLEQAVKYSRSVCKVEEQDGSALGTGFLYLNINTVITNFHLFNVDSIDELESKIASVNFRFGLYEFGSENQCVFKANSLVAFSPTEKLDYVLINLESNVFNSVDIELPQLNYSPPEVKSGLHLLHHPGGETMKLNYSTQGVTSVLREDNKLQYVTSARSGSSGAPCFDDNWKIVAVHHAQRNKSFGSVRQGVLINAIQDSINSQKL